MYTFIRWVNLNGPERYKMNRSPLSISYEPFLLLTLHPTYQQILLILLPEYVSDSCISPHLPSPCCSVPCLHLWLGTLQQPPNWLLYCNFCPSAHFPHNSQSDRGCYSLGNWRMSFSYFKFINCFPLCLTKNQSLPIKPPLSLHSQPSSPVFAVLTTLVFSFQFLQTTPSCLFTASWPLDMCNFLYREYSCLHLHGAGYFWFFKCQPKCLLSARSLSTPSKGCLLLGLPDIKTYFETSVDKVIWYEKKLMELKKDQTLMHKGI